MEKYYGVRQLNISGDYWQILNHFLKILSPFSYKNEGLS
jgi:hypothetical protein